MNTMSDPLDTITVNQLIQLDTPDTGDKAFVHYTGTINTNTHQHTAPTLTDDYLGVEWLTPSRGKHNGYYNHHQYFTAQTHNCSFIRRQRVLPVKTLRQVLSEKYVQNDTYTNIINDKKYEFRGEQLNQSQFRNLALLRLVNVSHSQVDDTVDVQLGEVIPNVVEMDLTNNLITRLDYISQFASFAHLQVLNLSRNYISAFVNTDVFDSLRFNALTTLIMNDTAVDASVLSTNLVRLLESGCMPKLSQLVLVRNSIHTMVNGDVTADRYCAALQTVQTLDLSNNCVQPEFIEHVLSRLPNLTKLVLSHNRLPHWHYTSGFDRLTHLSVDNNALMCLCCVDQIAKLPVLTHLNIKSNAFTSDTTQYFTQYDQHPAHTPPAGSGSGNTGSSATQLAESVNLRLDLIARLPNVQFLNNSEISEKTRASAEIHYVRTCTHAHSQICNNGKPIEHYYSRYRELTAKYSDAVAQASNGDVEKKTLSDIGNLQNTVCQLNLVCIMQCKCTGKQQQQVECKQMSKNIPNATTVNKLKLLAGKLFGVKSTAMCVRYASTSDCSGSQLVDDRQAHKSLMELDIHSGSTVWLTHDKQCKCAPAQ